MQVMQLLRGEMSPPPFVGSLSILDWYVLNFLFKKDANWLRYRSKAKYIIIIIIKKK